MKSINRRKLLGIVLPVATVLSIAIPTVAEARRRVRFSGRGLPTGAKYNGPTLSRSELGNCVKQERSINEKFAALEKEEVDLKSAELNVDSYSQRSVDEFNQRVSNFNSGGEAVNAQVYSFNQSCANRTYYESDMQAVESLLRRSK
jgi:hypothetical protein